MTAPRSSSAVRTFLLPALAAGVLLTLTASAAPAVAQAPGGCAPGPSLLGLDSPEAVIASTVVTVARGGGIDGPGAQSDCTAECGGGVTVTCGGSWCSAFDRGCPSQEGYCTGSDGTKVCPEPCPCSVTKHCPDGTILSCTGSYPFCDGGEWACYVDCDWNPQYCPGHWGEETC